MANYLYCMYKSSCKIIHFFSHQTLSIGRYGSCYVLSRNFERWVVPFTRTFLCKNYFQHGADKIWAKFLVFSAEWKFFFSLVKKESKSFSSSKSLCRKYLWIFQENFWLCFTARVKIEPPPPSVAQLIKEYDISKAWENS